MTTEEFRTTLTALGWTPSSLARLLDIPAQTVQQWAMGRARVPEAVAQWVTRRLACLEADPAPWVPDQRLRRG